MALFRNSSTTLSAAAFSALFLVYGSPAAVASPTGVGNAAIHEVDVTNMLATKEGQPTVAVNPRNPKNLVFVSTIFPPSPGLEPVDGGCFLAYSNDRGDTWTQVAWPLGTAAPKCGEPSVQFDAKGTVYVDNNQVSSGLAANLVNHNQVAKSTDGGRTWTDPVSTPLLLGGAPKMRVDAATGKVYAVAGAAWEYPSAVSVSADGGKTFSSDSRVIPGPMPCIEVAPGIPLVCGYPGREIAVYGGILVSASQEAGQPVNFHVSRDDGKTWTNTTLKDGQGNPVAAGTGSLVPVPALGAAADPVPWVAADTSHRGRFAVMVPRDSNTLDVYVTPDAGKTWTGPATISATGAVRPAIDFGANGDLGVMWRTTTGDAFSAVSFDHGRSFSAPVQVNHVTEPVGETGPPGDRWSGITLTDKYAYVTWADGRNNSSLDSIISRVPLKLYKKETASTSTN
ncbi:sialidase family protein [Streptomyces sp. MBT53]|uniref:sialidase family protein n=1 Tax=Streptomyces sp. MBT53 TaxID=1488384 RepID=UPI0019145D51|nr:sialidase family protein [Streptomyces sp. MBT53]MBK6016494.1 exo-alpha-sialidase [Streptomyces sp. MBT53]